MGAALSAGDRYRYTHGRGRRVERIRLQEEQSTHRTQGLPLSITHPIRHPPLQPPTGWLAALP